MLCLFIHTQAELGVEGPKKTSCAIRNVKGEIRNDKPKRRKEGLMQLSKRAPYMQTNAFYWWNADAGVHRLVINVFPSRLKSGGMWKKKGGNANSIGLHIHTDTHYCIICTPFRIMQEVSVINNLAISEH